MVSTVQGTTSAGLVKASSASVFVDSIGVDTHFAYPIYASHSAQLTQLLSNSGVKHIRDGAIPDAMQLLYPKGVKQTLVIDPPHGLVPNRNYWSAAPASQTTTISEFLKNVMPAGSVEALEMPNELDIFSSVYKWAPGDTTSLSTDPASPRYYGKYGQAVTKDCWTILKSDPALTNIKLIGPAVGTQVPSPYPDGSLKNYVDYGGFHPYPGRTNTWTYPQPYGTISRYYWDSFQPSGNIGEDKDGGNPLMFSWYAAAFTDGIDAKPMIATETGYNTNRSKGGISLIAQAKYVPRLFAEYYRNGIARTFIYELLDEGADLTDSQANCGLITNLFNPKPAYTALRSLITLLQDQAVSFTPGGLSYSLSVAPNGAYTRTDYVHDLLLQKSTGDFYLLIWHEISNSSTADPSGTPLSTMQRDITHPALSTTIKLPSGIVSATQYTYDQTWALSPRPLSIIGNSISVAATDTVTVIKLSTQASSQARPNASGLLTEQMSDVR